MAWIEAHQQLRDHPKLGDLRAATGWDLDTALGKLFRLWWWCMDYAEDGDLRRVSPAQIANGLGLDPQKGKWLLDALKAARLVDKKPYLRVHDWWKYAGPFLRAKYKRTPKNWQRVRNLYGYKGESLLAGDVTVTSHEMAGATHDHQPDRTGPTNLPTKPTEPKGDGQPVDFSAQIKTTVGAAVDKRADAMRQVRLLDLRMPFGQSKGLKIVDLEPDYCQHILTTCPTIGQELKDALALRVRVRAEEVAR